MREGLVNNIRGMRGFCVMQEHGATGVVAGRSADQREILLGRNLASVVRDAPYAVDHSSASSQRPIISHDTCVCPDKKRYVSRWKRSWKKLFHRDRENSGVARYGTGHVTPPITTTDLFYYLRLKYRISIKLNRVIEI